MADKGYAAHISTSAGIIGRTRTLAMRVRAKPYPGERRRAGLGADRAAERDAGHARGLAGQLAKQCPPDPIQPEDPAGTVLFLFSDASRMMTTQTLILDEGYISG